MPLSRQAAPDFWSVKEEQLLDDLKNGKKLPNVLAWTHQSRRISEWFHEQVRQAEEPRLCAYCDGPLGETSLETIDHFFPKEEYPELALCWENLYPACHCCNQGAKRSQWSCRLIRPDVDLLGKTAHDAFSLWFDFDPVTGKLSPAITASLRMRARARMTLGVFKINTEARCKARLLRWRNLLNAEIANDEALIHENASQGPYRFVAERYLASRTDINRP